MKSLPQLRRRITFGGVIIDGIINYTERARLVIESVYGLPPAEDSELYKFYSEAVEIQAELMEKQSVSSGLKRLSLGDYSEEYSEGADCSEELISQAAQALLAVVYPRAEVTVI